MLNKQTVKTVRTLHKHCGRIAAIKYLRTVANLPYSVANMAHQDIVTRQRWTYPNVKADAYYFSL